MDKNKKAMLGTDNKETATDKIKISAPPVTQTLPVTPQPVITRPSNINPQKLINPTLPPVFKPTTFVPQSVIPQAETIEKLKVDKNRPKGPELIKALIPTPPVTPSIQSGTPKTSGTKTSVADNIKQNESMLDAMDKKIEEMTGKKLKRDTLNMLKPAFENIASTINRTNQDKGEKDYDSQHVTVNNTQSLFTLTANQISSTPSYRMK